MLNCTAVPACGNQLDEKEKEREKKRKYELKVGCHPLQLLHLNRVYHSPLLKTAFIGKQMSDSSSKYATIGNDRIELLFKSGCCFIEFKCEGRLLLPTLHNMMTIT